ncbi:MAG: hypothetical protein PUG91_01910 [Clostridiales bacterium]|nr:hypothetical protein [Clostridiales bacterium]MDY2872365.1 hypothetical protein [Eubacteriales bacterium]
MKHGFYPASMSLSSARRAISLLLALVLLLSLSAPALAESDETDISAQDEILSAMTVYSWFTIAPLDVNGDVPAPDGGKYRVLDDELVSAETMQATMAAHFSDDLIDELWAWGSYETVDGQLYGYYPGESPYERPIDPDISEVEYALALHTDEARIYTVTVYSLSSDEPLLFEFIQEKTEDNRWVFTQFPFFW